MLSIIRKIPESQSKIASGLWIQTVGNTLTEKTVGIIGCGNIGSDVVELLAPLQCTFLVCDILDKSEFCRKNNATQTSLENLIEQSDVISLHVPFTQRTNKMADKKMFDQMKSTAFLVNTCRGDVVDQEALKTALTNGYIAGAALDVFAEEPPTDQEFLSLPNLMTTPHIGGNAKEAIDAMGRSAIDHLVSFFKNNLPHKS